GGVDGGGSGGDGAVGGELLSGPPDELTTHDELVDGDLLLLASAQHGDLFRAALEQGAQGGAGLARAAPLDVAAGPDEHRRPRAAGSGSLLVAASDGAVGSAAGRGPPGAPAVARTGAYRGRSRAAEVRMGTGVCMVAAPRGTLVEAAL